MAVWLVNAGRRGEHEQFALDNSLVVIGRELNYNLEEYENRDGIKGLLYETSPDYSKNTIENYTSELWTFRGRIHEGDIVVFPLKTRSVIAIGRITGEYRFHDDFPEGARHTRPVDWFSTDIPRTAFSPEVLSSFSKSVYACLIEQEGVEESINAILAGAPPPLPEIGEDEEPTEKLNLEEYSRDQIREHIARNFKRHDLEYLVEEILKAQGYTTQRSPVGPDGGVDIIAGRGPMGFDSPRLAVQVKSGSTPLIVNVLREELLAKRMVCLTPVYLKLRQTRDLNPLSQVKHARLPCFCKKLESLMEFLRNLVQIKVF